MSDPTIKFYAFTFENDGRSRDRFSTHLEGVEYMREHGDIQYLWEMTETGHFIRLHDYRDRENGTVKPFILSLL